MTTREDEDESMNPMSDTYKQDIFDLLPGFLGIGFRPFDQLDCGNEETESICPTRLPSAISFSFPCRESKLSYFISNMPHKLGFWDCCFDFAMNDKRCCQVPQQCPTMLGGPVEFLLVDFDAVFHDVLCSCCCDGI
jgi:hypothetical protein